jgi:hypothetical protein
MRKSTLLWLVLAAFCGTALYHTSQKVHDKREKLAALQSSIAAEEESLRVLGTEWSYLNPPARLEKLAKQYLGMAPLKGSQFVTAESLPPRAVAAPEIASVAEAPAAEKPAVTAETKKPAEKQAVKIRKTAAPVSLPKPAQKLPEAPQAAKNARSFNDIMQSLGAP